MKVENYFNHTAATYRGLHGQLCSIFPKYEGADGSDRLRTVERNSYFCLQDVFKGLGYTTSFFNSHSRDDSYTDEMMQYLKFQEVLSAEAIAATYLGGSGLYIGSYALSDRQLFSGLVERLKQQQASATEQPFFIALYSLETHANLDTNETDGIRYADGSNSSLNTIHNLDGALGDFLDYFLESPYATNTILIVTADHAHYHEEPFMAVFNDSDYQRLFVDRVPLIIYDPRQRVPRTFDPGIASSIDLAPTVVHLLGIQNQENGFVGRSIFETIDNGKRSSAIASYSDFYYYLVDGTIHGEENSREYSNERHLIKKFVRYSQYLEDQNRLWHR
jgi:phosphoglycerol transferase MdoB-like AlkP superfamily enzyme